MSPAMVSAPCKFQTGQLDLYLLCILGFYEEFDLEKNNLY